MTALLVLIGFGLVVGVVFLAAGIADEVAARRLPGPAGRPVIETAPLPEPRGPIRIYIDLDHARQERALRAGADVDPSREEPPWPETGTGDPTAPPPADALSPRPSARPRHASSPAASTTPTTAPSSWPRSA